MSKSSNGTESSQANFWDGLSDFFLIAAVCISPWLLGSEEAPYHVLLILLGFASLFCQFLRVLQGGKFQVPLDGPTWILGGFLLLGIFQLVPWPSQILTLLSPTASELRTQLLPAQPDTLDGNPLPWSSQGSISLHPYATKQFIYQIIVLLLFYLIARSGSHSVRRITRLCWCLMANGSILAFQAITQSFTSPPDLVYWSIPFTGAPFGPMNRDHFPDYMTLCIGASCALLTAVYHQSLPPNRSKYARTWNKMLQPMWEGLRSPLDLLQNPANLWVLLGLTFMLASVPMSGSRGGFGAMILGFLIALGLASQNLKKGGVPTYILWLIPVVIGFFSFIGWSFLESRVVAGSSLESLKNEGRWLLWLPLLDLGWKFPLFGTGFGTFLQAEHLVRIENLPGLTVDYAHNEYLEAWVEGGFPRLILTLSFFPLIIQNTITALRIHRNESHALLPAGICWGLSALAIHSFLDFGVHLPAVAITAIVLLGKLQTLCIPLPPKELPQPEESSPETNQPTLPQATITSTIQTEEVLKVRSGRRRVKEKVRLRHKKRLDEEGADFRLPIITFLLLGFLFILGQSVVYARVESLMVASRSARAKGDLIKEMAYLNDALKIAPNNALVHEAIGISLTLNFNDDIAKKKKVEQVVDDLVGVDAILAMRMGNPSGMGLPLGTMALALITDKANQDLAAIDKEKKNHFRAAVQSLEKARVLFPVLYRVHVNLGLLAPFSGQLSESFVTDKPSVHFARAMICFPIDAEIQFSLGQAHLLEGDLSTAADHFRASLERSRIRLPDVLRIARKHYSSADIFGYIFPDDPVAVFQALPSVSSQPESPERLRVLVRIMSLVAEKKGKIDRNFLLNLFAEMELSRIPPLARLEVLRNVQEDLLEDKAICLEIASIFEQAGNFDEAEKYAKMVLSVDPKNDRANFIRLSVARYRQLEKFLKAD